MPTLVIETEKMFPYGTFPVDSLFKDCYTQDYSRAQNYPLSPPSVPLQTRSPLARLASTGMFPHFL